MEFFYDEKARKRLNTSLWSRLHVIDPSIKLWKVGEKISDVNPICFASRPLPAKQMLPCFLDEQLGNRSRGWEG
jgi:hypothetical protein